MIGISACKESDPENSRKSENSKNMTRITGRKKLFCEDDPNLEKTTPRLEEIVEKMTVENFKPCPSINSSRSPVSENVKLFETLHKCSDIELCVQPISKKITKPVVFQHYFLS